MIALLSTDKTVVSYSIIKVIVLWTATTERFSSIEIGLNDTAENLLASIHVSTDQAIGIFLFISYDVDLSKFVIIFCILLLYRLFEAQLFCSKIVYCYV